MIDRPCRSSCLNHLLAGPAGKLRAHMLDDLVGGRNALQLLRNIFAELTQRAATIRAASCVEEDA